MRTLSMGWLATVLAGTVLTALAPADTKKVEKPLHVIVDVSDVPELKAWAAKAKELVVEWHPKIAEILKSDGFTPPTEVKLVFKKKYRFIAATGGRTITISGEWLNKHPDDYGMVIHELAHVEQSYKRGNAGAGWLVEGIADYVRFFKYEPNTKVAAPKKRDKAKSGYRTTARFLDWVQNTHDKELVSKLNRALRNGEYQDELFKRYTGKSIDDLWTAYVKDQTK